MKKVLDPSYIYMHSKVGTGHITSAFTVVDGQVHVALAFCSPLDQFSRRKGRLISGGRLDKEKTFCSFSLDPGGKTKKQVRDHVHATMQDHQERLPLWLQDRFPTVDHCDFFIHDLSLPPELRWFLFVNRLPAMDKHLVISTVGNPTLYARHGSDVVRVTMASSMGDVGITSDLDAERGYEKRVFVTALKDFSRLPIVCIESTSRLPNPIQNIELTCVVGRPEEDDG